MDTVNKTTATKRESHLSEVPQEKHEEEELRHISDQAQDKYEETSSPSNHSSHSCPLQRRSPSLRDTTGPKRSVEAPILNEEVEIDHTCGIAQGKAGQEGEEGITEIHRFCNQKEKEYPDLVLKPKEDPWPELSDPLREHDEGQVKAHNENIEALLVLSGLFSAIVTALIIEAYKLLQPDPVDTTTQILLQISMQLRSLSVNPGFINSTYVPPPIPPFSPRPGAVLLNVLWFASLVLSLATASLGVLVKQWLREYLSDSPILPEEYCQVRLFRIRGLRAYKVSEIASFLPILLQIALVLFFIGLILFVKLVHITISTVVSVLVGIWLFFIVGTTLLPVVSPSCPYKTPLLKSIFFHLRNIINALYKMMKTSSIGLHFRFLPGTLFIEECTSDMSAKTKAEVLLETYETFRDINSWDTIMRCVNLNSPLESLRVLSALVKHLHGSEITFESNLGGLFDQSRLRLLLKSMTACLRRASVVALKGGESAWLGPADVVHLVTLRLLYFAFQSHGGSDAALDSIVIQLTRPKHVLSVQAPDIEFVRSYILSISGLSPSHLPETISRHRMRRVINYALDALDSDSVHCAGFKCSASLPHILEICRISLLCEGRTTFPWREKNKFLQLTVRLAESLRSISYTEGMVNPTDVFRSQCALDMAMRLHMKVPGIVDRSLFRALHECSVKMFNLRVEGLPRTMGSRSPIRGRNNAPSNDLAPDSAPEADWRKILRGEQYIGVQIGGYGNGRPVWYHKDLQSSCKQRIEFMWGFIRGLGLNKLEEEFRSILKDFEIGYEGSV